MSTLYTDEVAEALEAELSQQATITPDGAWEPVDIAVIFHERNPEAPLDQLRKPHDGPIAKVRVWSAVAAGLPLPLSGVLVLASGRSFNIKRSAFSKTGAQHIADLVEIR